MFQINGPNRKIYVNAATNHRAMTLIEILIVTSLIAVTSIAIHQSMVNGINVWNKSRQMGMEEDIVIFFDKISHELCNTFSYSKFGFEGDQHRVSFPVIFQDFASNNENNMTDDSVDQLGRLEYYFDSTDKSIYRRKAYYGQALDGEFSAREKVAEMIEQMNISYIYFTENGEIKSAVVLDSIPLGLEISVEALNEAGNRLFKRYIEIPLQT